MRKELKKSLIWIFLSLICFSCSLPKAPVENQKSSKKDKPDRILEGHKKAVNDIVFSLDGKLISASADKTIRMWDVETGDFSVLSSHKPVLKIALSPDGKWLASGLWQRDLWLWDFPEKEAIKVLSKRKAVDLCFSPDSNLLAMLTRSGKYIIFWEMVTQTKLPQIKKNSRDFAWHGDVTEFSPDGSLLAVATRRGTVELWKVQKRKLLREFTSASGTGLWTKYGITALTFSPDGRLLIGASYFSETVTVWDVSTGQIVKSFKSGKMRKVAFSPDGSVIALGTNPVSLWDTTTWQLVKKIDGAHSLVAFSPDGKWLACSYQNNTIGLWSTDWEKTKSYFQPDMNSGKK